MDTKLITAIEAEPITKAEVKSHLRLDASDTSEDTQIDIWITAAREYCEAFTGRALATQTREGLLNDFPSTDNIEIPKPPLQSVTSVKYKDSDGDETTMTADTDYIVNTDNEPGEIFLPYNDTWPSFTPYPFNAVRIRYVCGYDGETYILPKLLKSGLLYHVGLMYKYRDCEIPVEEIETVHRLYYPFRVVTF